MLAVALLAVGAAVGCKQTAPPPAIDAGMAACITGDTVAAAGADLDRLRASSFVNGAGGSVRGLLEQYGSASKLLVAWNASDVLILLRGLFKTPPAGATMIAPGLAAAGSPKSISSALAQYRSGQTGAAGLIDYGSEIGARSAIWLAVRGGTPLPLSGNLANLNHLLEDAEYAGATLDLGETATLRLAARGRTADSAERLEERLRGFLSLAGEAEIRRPELAGLLGNARIERSGRNVTAALAAPPDLVAKLLADFAR
jgi:hypothetical protein